MHDDKGLIFHVIRGSFVDGYGIRTTVFLKGCPLQCTWCCNPEGQKGYPEIKLTPTLCSGCGRCLAVCPANAVRLHSEGPRAGVEIDRGLCTNCGRCVEVCYTGALDFFGRLVTAGELLDLVKRDEPFYRASGGGVTIGGGEPTLQADFTLALLRRCRENNLHTALDTCGYTATPAGRQALAEADLLLFDLKGMDKGAHWQNTRVSNELILANLQQLDAAGKPIIIRVPVIPGYTDAGDNMEATARFLAGLKHVERVDLLPVHEYGKIKYEQLGKEYRLRSGPLSRPRQDEIKALFKGYGHVVQIGG